MAACSPRARWWYSRRPSRTRRLMVSSTFYVGSTLKGVGRVYQQTVIDTYHEVVLAKLYTRKTPLTADDILNDRVIPFFDEHEIRVDRILTIVAPIIAVPTQRRRST